MLDPFEPFFSPLGEIDLRSGEKFLAKYNFVLIRQFEGSFIGKLIIRDRLMPIFQEMAVLMLDFPHYFLH